MSKAINLALDTTKSDINNPTYKLRQGDGNYQTIRATITANGEPFDLTDVSVSFNGTTAANTKVIDYNVVKIDILQGVIEYTPNKQMGSSVGRYKEAYFRFTKGDSTATTASFNIDVTTSVDINNEDAKDYVSIVDTVVKNLNDTTEKQLAHSDEVINGHIDELSEKIESTTQDFNEKANKATSSVLEAQQIIDTKLSNVEKQIEEDVSNTNDRVKQLNDALDNIKADEPNYAKLNSENTFKGKNTFEQKVIAPNGIQGKADNSGHADSSSSLDNSADIDIKGIKVNNSFFSNSGGFWVTGNAEIRKNLSVEGDTVVNKLDVNGPLFTHGDVVGFESIVSKKVREAYSWDNGLNVKFNRVGNSVYAKIFGSILYDHPAFTRLLWDIPYGFRPVDEAHLLASVGYSKGIIKVYPDGSAWNVDQTFKVTDNNGGDGIPYGFGSWETTDDFPA